MNILLDTCSVLWFLNGDDKIPASARDIVLNARNTIFVSIATTWEVAIKMSIGKLHFDGGIDGCGKRPQDYGRFLTGMGITSP